jgi:hypothetical protein
VTAAQVDAAIAQVDVAAAQVRAAEAQLATTKRLCTTPHSPRRSAERWFSAT